MEKSEYKDRADFITGNILDPRTFPEKKFDIILIKRVLINLVEEKDQIIALDNVKNFLNDNGRIILSEAVEENWARLNRLRMEFGLDELKQPWHNKYLNDNVIKYLYSHFCVELDNDCRIGGQNYFCPPFQERTLRLSSQYAQTSHYPVVRAH